jgi:hypothetical protein
MKSEQFRTGEFRPLAVGVVVFCILASVVTAWSGGDPWKTKPFETWDQNDVRQILNDSPWAKLARVPADWMMNQQSGNGKSEMGRAPGGTAAAAEGPGGSSTPNYGAPSMLGTPEGQTVFIIRWYSSRTIREALVRDQILNGQLKESDAAQYLGQPTNYEVVVIGPDMTPFGSASEDALKAASYIQAKQSKIKVNATAVDISRSPDGHKVMAVMFSFPMKTAKGDQVISADDSGVKFVCKTRDIDLDMGFDLRKMVDQKGPDF